MQIVRPVCNSRLVFPCSRTAVGIFGRVPCGDEFFFSVFFFFFQSGCTPLDAELKTSAAGLNVSTALQLDKLSLIKAHQSFGRSSGSLDILTVAFSLNGLLGLKYHLVLREWVCFL